MDEIVNHIKPFSEKVMILNASEIVEKETGSVLTSNIFILGYVVAKGFLPIKEKFVLEAIKENVPEKYFELNKKIFELGMNYKN